MKSALLLSLPLATLFASRIQGAPTSNPPLRGSEDLLGYSSSNTLSDQTTEDITYTPVDGQTDDADLGVYLDFEDSDSPQPIRGNKGATDPGPSKASSFEAIEKQSF